MKKTVVWFMLLCLGVVWPALASDVSQPQSVLYPFKNSIMVQEDFLNGINTAGQIGSLGFTTAGGLETAIVGSANRFGIIQVDTSAVINTVASMFLNNPGTLILPANDHSVLWVSQLNTNDANTLVRIGAFESPIGNPPADGIYFEKLAADTNWFCVTRAAGVQTRTDSTVAVGTAYKNFKYTRNSSGVQFTLDQTNVCSVMTTNIPTLGLRATVELFNSAAASKTLDNDYFELRISGITR